MDNSEFKTKQFSRAIRGYDIEEVNTFVNELLHDYKLLKDDNAYLKRKVSSYEKQSQFIQSALITAEESASVIKSNAEKQAEAIEMQGKQKAYEIVEKTLKETKAYRDEVHKCYYNYERDIRLSIDYFYTLVHQHMASLEKEFAQKIEDTLERFDKEYNKLPELYNIKHSHDQDAKLDIWTNKKTKTEPAMT